MISSVFLVRIRCLGLLLIKKIRPWQNWGGAAQAVGRAEAGRSHRPCRKRQDLLSTLCLKVDRAGRSCWVQTQSWERVPGGRGSCWDCPGETMGGTPPCPGLGGGDVKYLLWLRDFWDWEVGRQLHKMQLWSLLWELTYRQAGLVDAHGAALWRPKGNSRTKGAKRENDSTTMPQWLWPTSTTARRFLPPGYLLAFTICVQQRALPVYIIWRKGCKVWTGNSAGLGAFLVRRLKLQSPGAGRIPIYMILQGLI